MTADKELLELAAKACGYNYANAALWNGREVVAYEWNPIADDGDALRLAVKLGMSIDFGTKYAFATTLHTEAQEELNSDPYAATRRAIVRAAAAIGAEK